MDPQVVTIDLLIVLAAGLLAGAACKRLGISLFVGYLVVVGQEPVLLTAGLAGMLMLKTAAATLALRLIGLRWTAAMGMGIGLAQLGELSFSVLAV